MRALRMSPAERRYHARSGTKLLMEKRIVYAWSTTDTQLSRWGESLVRNISRRANCSSSVIIATTGRIPGTGEMFPLHLYEESRSSSIGHLVHPEYAGT